MGLIDVRHFALGVVLATLASTFRSSSMECRVRGCFKI